MDISFWHWLILAAVLIIGEILAPGAFLLWLGFAALASALVSFVAPQTPWELQGLLFAIFSIISLFAWHKYGKSLNMESDAPNLNQRNQQYVGRTLTLAEPIENGVGKVVVDDTQWKVTGQDAPKGSNVLVTGAKGNILVVQTVTD
jgi:membrane protein implicated in regulation of membrane protease activity